MSFGSKTKSLFSYKSFISVRDVLPRRISSDENEIHLKAAIGWLAKAQDYCNKDGISASYSLKDGWLPAYPETTGYIIPTFYDWAVFSNCYNFRERAKHLADWELSIQLDCGAFPALTTNSRKPMVFDTGQVIFGLIRAFIEENKSKYLEAAQKACYWLVKIQNLSGAWKKYVLNDIVHTYNTRTAWALLEVFKKNRDQNLLLAAMSNLDWSLKQQLHNGWFKNNGFTGNDHVTTHTTAYCIRGLLESGIILGEQKYLNAAKKAADALLLRQREGGSLAGTFNENWEETSRWSCLTGNAQIALIWFRLYEITKEKMYLAAAKRINYFMKSLQNLNSSNPGIRGGLKGSHPIFGKYLSYSYPNWAAKFFVDSLLMEQSLNGKIL